MTANRTETGLAWEDAAGSFLEHNGVRTLLKRYRCRRGEIDLVCDDGGTLVIVEVRARRGGAMVSAAESVDWRKRRKIVQAARHLLMCRPGFARQPIRFDVVAIDGIDTEEPKFNWIKDAFDAG